jgi:hypothetical protein
LQKKLEDLLFFQSIASHFIKIRMIANYKK